MLTSIQNRILSLKDKKLSIGEQHSSHWWEPSIKKEDFSIYEGKNGNFYVRHRKWKEELFIGAFSSKEECCAIIDSYVSPSPNPSVTKKIHSLFICNENFLKKI